MCVLKYYDKDTVRGNVVCEAGGVRAVVSKQIRRIITNGKH